MSLTVLGQNADGLLPPSALWLGHRAELNLRPRTGFFFSLGYCQRSPYLLQEQRLLATFSTDLDKIQETRAKIEEVATMVGLFATKVAEQTEQTETC